MEVPVNANRILNITAVAHLAGQVRIAKQVRNHGATHRKKYLTHRSKHLIYRSKHRTDHDEQIFFVNIVKNMK